jgi:peptide deformylase
MLQKENQRLKAALDAFRSERGFGRGIAAPQIGIPKRFICFPE